MADVFMRILLSAQGGSGVTSAVQGVAASLGGGSISGGGSGLGGALGGVAGIAIAAGTALVGLGVKSVQMAADYQQSMNMVQALTGASADQMKQYDAGVKALAIDAGVAPEKLSKGLYNVISAGYSGATAMTVLKLATEDAKIGMTDSATTSNALTIALKAFNIPAKDFVSVNGEMLRTVTAGKMTMSDYASAISKTSSVAVQYKDSMSDMNAVLATLTANGIKNANIAGTDYNNLLKVLNGNTQSVISKSEALNPAFDGTAFASMNVADKVDYLNKMIIQHGHNITDVIGKQQNAAAAFTTLSTHTDEYRKNLKALSDQQANAKATQDAWNITQSGFNQQLSRLGAAIQVVGINIGTKLLPIVTWAAKWLTTLVQWLSDAAGKVGKFLSSFDFRPITRAWQQLTDAVQRALKPLEGANGVMKKMSPFLTDLKNGFARLIESGIKDVAGFISHIADAINGLQGSATVLKPVTNGLHDTGEIIKKLKPTTDVLNGWKNAIAGVVKVGGGAKSNKLFSEIANDAKTLFGIAMNLSPAVNLFQALIRHARELAQWFNDKVKPALKDAEPGFRNLGDALAKLLPAFKTISDIVHNTFQKALDDIFPTVEKAIPLIIRLSGIIANGLGQALKFLTPYALQATRALGKFATDIVDRVAPMITGWLDSVQKALDLLQKHWSTIWGILGPIVQGSWDQIVGIAKIMWAILTGIIKVGLDAMTGNWGQAWADVKDMFAGIWDGIKTFAVGIWENIQGFFKLMTGTIKSIFQGLANDLVGHSIIPDMINNIVSWFQQLPGRAGAAIASLPGNIMGILNGMGASVYQAGLSITTQIASGITAGIGMVGTAIGQVVSFIADHLPHSPAKIGPLRTLMASGTMISTQIASGITSGMGQVQRAMSPLAQAIAHAVNPSIVADQLSFAQAPTEIYRGKKQPVDTKAEKLREAAQLKSAEKTVAGEFKTIDAEIKNAQKRESERIKHDRALYASEIKHEEDGYKARIHAITEQDKHLRGNAKKAGEAEIKILREREKEETKQLRAREKAQIDYERKTFEAKIKADRAKEKQLKQEIHLNLTINAQKADAAEIDRIAAMVVKKFGDQIRAQFGNV